MKPEPITDFVINEEALKLAARLEAQSTSPSPMQPVFDEPVRRQFSWHPWQRIAASFLILLLASATAWFLFFRQETLVYRTADGESKMVLLPDGSVVFLGENSQLRYHKTWPEPAIRQVWLEGDAYFHVKPKPVPGGVKFQVHAAQAIVEVLGTRFNVWNRNQNPRILLNSGKVKVNVESKPEIQAVFMKRGEMVELEANGSQLVKTQAVPQEVPPQKGQNIVFDKTPIREIALVIEEYYGLKVQLQEPSMANLVITGTLPTNNETSFLNALSVILDVVIVRKANNQILFKYNH